MEVHRVVGEGAVADGHRATILVGEAAAVVGGEVVGEGAVADGHRAAIVEEAGTVPAQDGVEGGQAMSNGEGVEGEGDAAIDGEQLRAVAAIEGDVLPAAIESQVVRADGERAGDGDGATTTEGDRVSGGGTTQHGADLARAVLSTTIGDGISGGMGGPHLHAQREARPRSSTRPRPRRTAMRHNRRTRGDDDCIMDAFLRYASTLGMRPPPSKRDGHPSATNTKPGASNGVHEPSLLGKAQGTPPTRQTTDRNQIEFGRRRRTLPLKADVRGSVLVPPARCD